MLNLIYEKRFEKDLLKVIKRGKDLQKLREVTALLKSEQPLPAKNYNHKLKGPLAGCWKCHLEPDWLLVYKKTATEIILSRTGTHSDLF